MWQVVSQFVADRYRTADPARFRGLHLRLLARLRDLLAIRNPTVGYRIGDIGLAIPLSHDLLVHRWRHPEYGENLGRLAGYLEQFHPDLKVIDIGANVGDTAAIIRQRSACPILCIEADPGFFALLAANAPAIGGLTLENRFVAAAEGEVGGRLAGSAGTARLVASDPGDRGIQGESLAQILSRHPEFADFKLLKIDTDGFDLRIVLGALATLARAKPVLFLEYAPDLFMPHGDDGIGFFARLGEAGYRKALFYDNTGDFLLATELSESALIEDLDAHFRGRGSARYADVALFHAVDDAIADNARRCELAHFAKARNHAPAATGGGGRRTSQGVRTARVFENGRLAYYRGAADPEFWDRHWRAHFDPNLYTSPSRGFLPDHLRAPFLRWLPKPGRILEAGCGFGHHVLALRARGYDAEGIDFAPKTVELARRHLPDVPIRLGDATRLDVADRHYAGYISLGVVEHRQDGPGPFLAEAWRVLAAGGIAIVAVPWCNSLRRWKARRGWFRDGTDGLEFYQYAFAETEFLALLAGCGFEILEWSSYGPLKGLKDELPALSWMLARRRLGPLVERALRKLFRVLPRAARPLGHMLLVVVRKPGGSG